MKKSVKILIILALLNGQLAYGEIPKTLVVLPNTMEQTQGGLKGGSGNKIGKELVTTKGTSIAVLKTTSGTPKGRITTSGSIATPGTTITGILAETSFGKYEIPDFSAIVGGANNEIYTSLSAIVGGINNKIYRDFTSKNQNSGDASAIIGGDSHIIEGGFASVILGGYSNYLSAYFSAMVAGKSNKLKGDKNKGGQVAVAGENNEGYGLASVLVGGIKNILKGDNSIIVSGEGNILKKGEYSEILGGEGNIIEGKNSQIINGNHNNIIGEYSGIVGGERNKINGNNNNIIGGHDNNVNSTGVTVLGGAGIKVNKGKNVLIMGSYNEDVDGAAMVIGGGTGIAPDPKDPNAPKERSNVIVIKNNGEMNITSNFNIEPTSILYLDGKQYKADDLGIVGTKTKVIALSPGTIVATDTPLMFVDVLDYIISRPKIILKENEAAYKEILPTGTKGEALIKETSNILAKDLGVRKDAKIEGNLTVEGESELVKKTEIGGTPGTKLITTKIINGVVTTSGIIATAQTPSLKVNGESNFDRNIKVGKHFLPILGDLGKMSDEISGLPLAGSAKAKVDLTSVFTGVTSNGAILNNYALTTRVNETKKAIEKIGTITKTTIASTDTLNNDMNTEEKKQQGDHGTIQSLLLTGLNVQDVVTKAEDLLNQFTATTFGTNSAIDSLVPTGTTGAGLVRNSNLGINGNVGVKGDTKLKGNVVILRGKNLNEALRVDQLLETSNQVLGTSIGSLSSLATEMKALNVLNNKELTTQIDANTANINSNTNKIKTNNDEGIATQDSTKTKSDNADSRKSNEMVANAAGIEANKNLIPGLNAKITTTTNRVKSQATDLLKVGSIFAGQKSIGINTSLLYEEAKQVAGTTSGSAVKFTGIDNNNILSNQKITEELKSLVTTAGPMNRIDSKMKNLSKVSSNSKIFINTTTGASILPIGTIGETLVQEKNFAVKGDFAVNGNTKFNGTLVIQDGKSRNEAVSIGQALTSSERITGAKSTIDPITGKITSGIDNVNIWTNEKITKTLATLVKKGGTLDKMITNGDTTTLNNNLKVNKDLDVKGNVDFSNGGLTIRDGRSLNEASSVGQLMNVSNQISGMTSRINGKTGEITTGVGETDNLAYTNKELTKFFSKSKSDIEESKRTLEKIKKQDDETDGAISNEEIKKIVKSFPDKSKEMSTKAEDANEIANQNISGAKKLLGKNKAKILENKNQINILNKRIKRESAMTNAMIAASAISINDVEIGELGIGLGYGYDNSNTAMALSLGFRETENLGFTVGVSGSVENGKEINSNIGINYKFNLFN